MQQKSSLLGNFIGGGLMASLKVESKAVAKSQESTQMDHKAIFKPLNCLIFSRDDRETYLSERKEIE